jgi:hypothetical protein
LLAPHGAERRAEWYIAEQPLKVEGIEVARDPAELTGDLHQLASAMRLAERLFYPSRHENEIGT